MSYDGTSRAVSWKIEGNTFNMDLVIPPNTAATVFIPAKKGCKNDNLIDR